MRELVTLSIGSAGVQIGESLWELYCLQHGINEDGFKIEKKDYEGSSDVFPLEWKKKDTHGILFNETKDGKYNARAGFIDLDPIVTDQVKKGKFRSLFSPNNIVSGKENGSDNFARGMYTVGKKPAEKMIERTRKLVEACDFFGGFQFVNSMGGGTGSGVFGNIADKLNVEYPKIYKTSFSIYPSPTLRTGVLECYNTLLGLYYQFDKCDSCVMFDNEALYNVCNSIDLEYPNYKNINRLISHSISSYSSPLRTSFGVTPNIITSLIPYPRIHFFIPTFSGFVSPFGKYENKNVVDDFPSLVEKLYSKECVMASIDLKKHKFYSSFLGFTGENITASEMYRSCHTLINDKEMKIFSVAKKSPFKCCMNTIEPKVVENAELGKMKKSIFSVSNNSGVAGYFERIRNDFNKMYRYRSFVYWYVGEGMEEGEFSECCEDIKAISADYKECFEETPEDED